jgi:hypothetical protein
MSRVRPKAIAATRRSNATAGRSQAATDRLAGGGPSRLGAVKSRDDGEDGSSVSDASAAILGVASTVVAAFAG